MSAVLDHYTTGSMRLSEGLNAIKLQQHISNQKDENLEELFESVESELSSETSESVDFFYDTKLTFPAELALGKLYGEARSELPEKYSLTKCGVETGIKGMLNPIGENDSRNIRTENEHQNVLDNVSRAEEFTDLVIGLLVEGDMRDAIQDDEYCDFETDAQIEGAHLAETAQETLFKELQPQLENYPAEVKEAYEKAVNSGMSHQQEDKDFRRMFEEAQENPDEAEDIVKPYRNGNIDASFSLDWSGTDLPFFGSQYERVGVLYDGMFEMYDQAELETEGDFKRSVVLSTIGAQIWLDDVDDLNEDWENGQLTPVTAEILTSQTKEQAYSNIVSMKNQYLDAAREYAVKSKSDLASISIEYINRRGEELNLKSRIRSIE